MTETQSKLYWTFLAAVGEYCRAAPEDGMARLLTSWIDYSRGEGRVDPDGAAQILTLAPSYPRGWQSTAWAKLAYTAAKPASTGVLPSYWAWHIMAFLCDVEQERKRARGEKIPRYFYDERESKAPPVDRAKVARLANLIMRTAEASPGTRRTTPAE